MGNINKDFYFNKMNKTFLTKFIFATILSSLIVLIGGTFTYAAVPVTTITQINENIADAEVGATLEFDLGGIPISTATEKIIVDKAVTLNFNGGKFIYTGTKREVFVSVTATGDVTINNAIFENSGHPIEFTTTVENAFVNNCSFISTPVEKSYHRAIIMQAKNFSISNSTFEGGWDYGIYNTNVLSEIFNVVECEFNGIAGVTGGGIGTESKELNVYNSDFDNGASISVSNVDGDANIENCTFNSSINPGTQSGISATTKTLNVRNSKFANLSSGIYTLSPTTNIIECDFGVKNAIDDYGPFGTGITAKYSDTGEITVTDCNFYGNKGCAIKSTFGNTIVETSENGKSVFEGNKRIDPSPNYSGDGGGAISTYNSYDSHPRKIYISGNVHFINNFNTWHGGAIYSDGEITLDGPIVFEGNSIDADKGHGGGAIFSKKSVRINGPSNGDMIFKNNSCPNYYYGGGAVLTNMEVDITGNVIFEDNWSESSGGAIYGSGSYNKDYGILLNGNVTFIGNHAGLNGGACYSGNHMIIKDNAKFENNTLNEVRTTPHGGGVAIYSYNSIIIKDFKNISFLNNEDLETETSGIIYGKDSVIVDNTNNGTLEINGNKAKSNGGIYSPEVKIDNRGSGTIAFNNNENRDTSNNGRGSAIHATRALEINNSSTGKVIFSGNKSPNAGGGAISASGNTAIDGVTFNNNISSFGGAIYVTGEVSIKNSMFNGNKASSTKYGGGAIYIGTHKPDVPISIENSSFENNIAENKDGGAIFIPNFENNPFYAQYLILDNVKFNNNKAATSTRWELNSSLFESEKNLYNNAVSDTTNFSKDENGYQFFNAWNNYDICCRVIKNVVNVIFDSQGGTLVESQTIILNGNPVEPEPPTKANATFLGWFNEKEAKSDFIFPFPIATNTIVYAGWKADPIVTTTTPSASPSTLPIVTPTATNSTKVTPTVTTTATATPTVTVTPTATPTETLTPIVTVTATSTPTSTPTETLIPTVTATPTETTTTFPTDVTGNNFVVEDTKTPIIQNNVTFNVSPVIDQENVYIVFDEFGTPLGSITVPDGQNIEDIDIMEELTPLGGINVLTTPIAKENPKTGITNSELIIACLLMCSMFLFTRKGKKILG